uniref:Abhydrolase domain containing 17C, depalmitoylase n=1 Tax=Ovis aries TaxID=9940 RepID=A0AC11D8Q4_SHEEP
MQPTSLTAALEYLDTELEFCAGVTQTKCATEKRGVCLHHHVLASSCDVPDIDKISKVTSPVLVIHGTEDEVIDFSHGLAMYERCPRAVEPLWVEGAGHNDIELYAQYLERLKQFISHELPNS